jgi:DnaA family protein
VAGRAEQLLLSLRPPPAVDFESFYIAPGNTEPVAALREWLDRPRGGLFFLAGPGGSGRSHLLQAACTRVAGALYLPLRELRDEDPELLLEGLENCPLLCLDDIDAVLDDRRWCEALFHLFNRQIGDPAAPSAGKWLVTAAAAAAQLVCALPDLQSRLGWGVLYRLVELDDEGRARLLQFRGRQRGMVIGDDVAAYILRRHDRDGAALSALLDRLDRESLRAGQRITIPFVRSLLG